MLKKGDILNAVELRHEIVEMPEWGGEVRISEMTAGDYDKYQRSLYTVRGEKFEQDLTHMVSSYLQACLVNDDGSRMFTLDEIKTLPAKPVAKLYEVAQRVNGEGVDGKAEIEKNSEGGQDE